MQKYFDQAINLYKKKWQTVLILALIAQIPAIASEVLHTYDIITLRLFTITNIVIQSVIILCAIISTLGLVLIVKNPEKKLNEIIKHTFKALWAYVLTMLILILIVISVIIIPIIIFAALSAYATLSGSSFGLFLVNVATFVFSLLFLVIGFYYVVRLNFIVQSVVIANKKSKQALQYTLDITQKKFWKIAKALLIIALVFIGISFIPYGFVLTIFLSPLASLFMTFLFIDLKNEYEKNKPKTV